MQQHCQNAVQVPRAAADEGVRRRGQVIAGLRRAAGNDRQVFGRKRRLIFLQQLHRVGPALDGKNPPLFRLKRHFNGHRAGARTNIVADRTLAQVELGERDGAHLALRHGYNAALPLAAQESAVRQAVGHHGVRAIVFDQDGAQGCKCTAAQRFRRAGGNLFVRVAQPFADAQLHLAKPILYQRFAQVRCAVLAADEHENALMRAHLRHNIVRASVQADDVNFLIGRLQLCAEAGERAQPRQHIDLTVGKQRQQLSRAAEKPRIARHHNCASTVFAVRMDMVCDLLRRNGGKGFLPLPRGGVQHALRTDQAVRLLDRAADFARHHLPASRADADNAHLRTKSTAKARGEQIQHLRKGFSLPLLRPPDHKKLRPGLPRRGGLCRKTARFAAVFRHKPLRRHGAQHRLVHLLGKRALHCKDMGRFHSRLAAERKRRVQRQHAGVDAFAEALDLTVYF